jgi:hypothetical protein
MAPHARSYDRLRRGDLDSEGEDERSCSERRALSGLTTERRRTRWRGEAKRRDDDGVLAVRRGHSTSHFLSHQRGRAGRDVRAVVLRRDTWSAIRVPMPA